MRPVSLKDKCGDISRPLRNRITKLRAKRQARVRHHRARCSKRTWCVVYARVQETRWITPGMLRRCFQRTLWTVGQSSGYTYWTLNSGHLSLSSRTVSRRSRLTLGRVASWVRRTTKGGSNPSVLLHGNTCRCLRSKPRLSLAYIYVILYTRASAYTYIVCETHVMYTCTL